MRNALICVAVMTALFLSWPVVFGHDTGGVHAAQPHIADRAGNRFASADRSRSVRVSVPPASSRIRCARTFSQREASCATGHCRAALDTERDPCDATGGSPR